MSGRAAARSVALPVVTVTGPESTGKTTLAAHLAAALAVPWSAEHAREYLDARLSQGAPLDAALSAADVGPIARGQIAAEERAELDARRTGAPLVVRDTDLVSTVVYARHYYGRCPDWIVAEAIARRAALYLLCAPDVPWIDDGRRDRPAARDALHEELARTLDGLGCRWLPIAGDRAGRAATALAAVERLLGAATP